MFSNIAYMNTHSLELAIAEQNPHWAGSEYDHAFTRLHNHKAIEDLSLDEIQIITGIRRCGKSTLLQTLINHLAQQQDSKSILYINFDDPNYNAVCNDSTLMYDVINSAEKLSGVRVDTLCLDEVQNVAAWEQYIKSMYDAKRFKKIIVTGSNANLINSDYASLLTGRYIETRIFPMTYKETLLNHNITTPLELIQHKSLALRLLDSMLYYGGFPRMEQVEPTNQRLQILKGYYETIILKDCIKDHNVRDTRTLTNLAHYTLTNIASIYSYNSLSKAVSSNENTVKNFINIFEGAYFIEELKQFDYSLKKQLQMKKKIYCIDNGMLTAVSFRFSKDLEKLLENLTYTELKKSGENDIYFFNQQKECDFILHGEEEKTAIQVCYALTHENRIREINGLTAAMNSFDVSKGIIITYDQEETINESIQAIPFWKYFSFYSS